MDEQTYNEIQKLLAAVKALSKSVEKVVMTNMGTGAAGMMLKNYKSLHARAAQLLPDDYFITDTLGIDINEDASQEDIIAQVNFAASQLYDYLRNLTRENRSGFVWDESSWGGLGRDIQEQVLTMTRRTIKRAIANIDIDISDEGASSGARGGGKPKRKVLVQIEREDPADTDYTSDYDEEDDNPRMV